MEINSTQLLKQITQSYMERAKYMDFPNRQYSICTSATYTSPIRDHWLPRWHNGKEFTCQYGRCKRPGFDHWVGQNPWSRKQHPTPGLLPGEFPWTEEPGRLPSMGSQESEKTEGLSIAQDSTTSAEGKKEPGNGEKQIYLRSPSLYGIH